MKCWMKLRRHAWYWRQTTVGDTTVRWRRCMKCKTWDGTLHWQVD